MKRKWVSKPIFGREGIGILQSKNFSSYDEFVEATEDTMATDATTDKDLGRSIYQLYHELPTVQRRVIQTSSWVVKGVPAGINFREGLKGTDFTDINPFLPHKIENSKDEYSYNFKLSRQQYELRKKLYGAEENLPYESFYRSNERITNTKV